MDRSELAWAAGFFDGDGWTAHVRHRSTGRAVAQINQASAGGVPEVLIRFQAAVGGLGHIRGPKRSKGRKDLYWWFSTRRAAIEDIGRSIGPWLCPEKGAQFKDAVGLDMIRIERTAAEELAWAAGFFDAEGSTYLEKHRTHARYFRVEAAITQASSSGAPPELERFRVATGIAGHMYGPWQQEDANDRIYRWKVHRLVEVEMLLMRLEPRLGTVKREQARAAISVVRSQPLLPRGNPAWGSHKTHCIHGHAYDSARVRPYRSRGVGRQRRANKQCLACSREQARARRSASSGYLLK